MSDNIINSSTENFEQDVLKSEIPVLVDFWAPWCGPCRSIAPILEELATEYQGKVKIVKVNIDDHKDVAINYGVRSIPALYLFKSGEAVAQQVGAVPRGQLAGFIDSNI